MVMIDELAALTAYCAERELQRRAEMALNLLCSQGRAPGFVVFACLQDPRKEVIPSRGLFTQMVGLRLKDLSETAMVLGELAVQSGAHCHRIGPDAQARATWRRRRVALPSESGRASPPMTRSAPWPRLSRPRCESLCPRRSLEFPGRARRPGRQGGNVTEAWRSFASAVDSRRCPGSSGPASDRSRDVRDDGGVLRMPGVRGLRVLRRAARGDGWLLGRERAYGSRRDGRCGAECDAAICPAKHFGMSP